MVHHLHKLKFETEMANCHNHRIVGYSDNIMGISKLHFHFFYGISSYNGHTHYYSGITGLPVRTESGHIHKIEGELETNSMHEHHFSSFTLEDIEYKPGRNIKPIYA